MKTPAPARHPVPVPDLEFVHRVPLLTRRLRYAGRRLRYGQAQLFGDRIELSGWRLHGRYHRSIPLYHVVEMTYHPLENEGNLTIHLDTGEVVDLHVEEAHLWRQHFESWLSYHVLASAKVMREPEKAAAIAG